MHVREAIERLDAIHDRLARAEEYRGFRAGGVALAGAVGLLAAAAQPALAAPGPDGFVAYWVAVAAVCAALGGAPALFAYVKADDDLARRRARQVFGQFAPCLLVGAAATAAAVRSGPDAAALLPGLWATTFALGLISARPYLPPAVGRVGLFYLAAGVVLLARGAAHAEPSGWAVGGVFGPGHLAVALVLYLREREGGDDA